MTTDDPGRAELAAVTSRQFVVKTLLGLAVAVVLLYFLGWTVGWSEVLTTLSGANPWWVAVACLSTLACFAMWSMVWRVVMRASGHEPPYRHLLVTFLAAQFANYVTPLGQAGGEPFIAYVLSRDTEATFEDSLASVVTADLLNLLPFFNFAALGLGYLLLQRGLPSAAENLAVGLVAMAVGVPALVVVGWRHRGGVERVALAAVRPVARLTDRVSVAGVRRRIDRFYAAIETIAASPRALVTSLGFAYTGWLFFTLPLYFGALALDVAVDPIVVLFVVPASTLAGLVPTPGGLGSVEAALVVLLVALVPGLAGETALALALVYRVASYWFALLVGGVATFGVIARA